MIARLLDPPNLALFYGLVVLACLALCAYFAWVITPACDWLTRHSALYRRLQRAPAERQSQDVRVGSRVPPSGGDSSADYMLSRRRHLSGLVEFNRGHVPPDVVVPFVKGVRQ